jgi:hypothetical protein
MRHGASVFLGLSPVNRKLRRGGRVILKRERRRGADGPAFLGPEVVPAPSGMRRRAAGWTASGSGRKPGFWSKSHDSLGKPRILRLENGVLVLSNGDLVLSGGVPLNSDGVPLNSDGVPLNSDGAPLDSDGVRLNSDGVPLNPGGGFEGSKIIIEDSCCVDVGWGS